METGMSSIGFKKIDLEVTINDGKYNVKCPNVSCERCVIKRRAYKLLNVKKGEFLEINEICRELNVPKLNAYHSYGCGAPSCVCFVVWYNKRIDLQNTLKKWKKI